MESSSSSPSSSSPPSSQQQEHEETRDTKTSTVTARTMLTSRAHPTATSSTNTTVDEKQQDHHIDEVVDNMEYATSTSRREQRHQQQAPLPLVSDKSSKTSTTTATTIHNVSNVVLLKGLGQFRRELKKAVAGTDDVGTSQATATKESKNAVDAAVAAYKIARTLVDNTDSSDSNDDDNDLVDDEMFRYLFLMSNEYQPKVAVQHFLQHFQLKFELFGKDLLSKNRITLSNNDLLPSQKEIVSLLQSTTTTSSSGGAGAIQLYFAPTSSGSRMEEDSSIKERPDDGGKPSVIVFLYDKLTTSCKEPMTLLRAVYYALQVAMDHHQTQQHGMVVVVAVSSDSNSNDRSTSTSAAAAAAAAAAAEVSSSSSGGGGGAAGGSDTNTVVHDPHQLPIKGLVRSITSFPIRVVGVHSCGNFVVGDSTCSSFIDLLSKATNTKANVHSDGSYRKCVQQLLPDSKPVNLLSVDDSAVDDITQHQVEDDSGLERIAQDQMKAQHGTGTTAPSLSRSDIPAHPSDHLLAATSPHLGSSFPLSSNPLLRSLQSLQAQQQSRDSALFGLSQAARLGLSHSTAASAAAAAGSSLSAQHLLAAQARALSSSSQSVSLSQILAAQQASSFRSPYDSIYGDPLDALNQQRFLQNPYLTTSDLEAAILARASAAPMVSMLRRQPLGDHLGATSVGPGDELGMAERAQLAPSSGRSKKRSREEESKSARATEDRSASSATTASGGDSTGKRRKESKLSSPLCIYTESDNDTISAFQCLARQQIEFFAASEEDVQSNTSRMNKGIVVGQVGIRCRHCAILPSYSRPTAAVYYPRTLDSLYQFGQNLVKNHLCASCQLIPENTKKKMEALSEVRRRGKGGREHWAASARALGVVEDSNGLRFG